MRMTSIKIVDVFLLLLGDRIYDSLCCHFQSISVVRIICHLKLNERESFLLVVSLLPLLLLLLRMMVVLWHVYTFSFRPKLVVLFSLVFFLDVCLYASPLYLDGLISNVEGKTTIRLHKKLGHSAYFWMNQPSERDREKERKMCINGLAVSAMRIHKNTHHPKWFYV